MAVWSVVRTSELEGARRLDGEYYQPKYRIDFSKGCWIEVGEAVEFCQYGISQAMSEEPVGYPIFRMDDIENGFLADDDLKHVEITDDVFQKYRLEANDILFNRVNSEEFVGRTGIFKLKGDYVFASYLIRIRIKGASGILPDYLSVFLNSTLGVRQIRKLSRRAVNQANVNAEELKTIKVAVLPLTAQEDIKRLRDKSFREFGRSKSLYLQAEQIVLDELGWKNLSLSQPKWWDVSLSLARKVRRLDAEHFQPKYAKVIGHLEKGGRARELGEIARHISRGVQPRYVEEGDVLVINSRHVGKQLVSVGQAERTDDASWQQNSNAQAKKYDVIMNSTGVGTVGRTNCVLHDRKSVVDNHVTIIRTRKGECNPVYLAVYLNSPPGLMQTDRWLSGSSGQIELYPAAMKRFLVYLPGDQLQREVATLVERSHQARERARALLDDAKAKVEELIDEGSH